MWTAAPASRAAFLIPQEELLVSSCFATGIDSGSFSWHIPSYIRFSRVDRDLTPRWCARIGTTAGHHGSVALWFLSSEADFANSRLVADGVSVAEQALQKHHSQGCGVVMLRINRIFGRRPTDAASLCGRSR
jgi:hypothetical protein